MVGGNVEYKLSRALLLAKITTDGALQLADKLTQQYEGKPTYYGHIAAIEKKDEDTLVLCRIEPIRVRIMG